MKIGREHEQRNLILQKVFRDRIFSKSNRHVRVRSTCCSPCTGNVLSLKPWEGERQWRERKSNKTTIQTEPPKQSRYFTSQVFSKERPGRLQAFAKFQEWWYKEVSNIQSFLEVSYNNLDTEWKRQPLIFTELGWVRLTTRTSHLSRLNWAQISMRMTFLQNCEPRFNSWYCLQCTPHSLEWP